MAVVLLLFVASTSSATCAVNLGGFAESDVTITTRVETSTSGHTGTVTLSRDGRGLGTRTVSAPRCEDLIEMMSLITSMALARIPAREPAPTPTIRRPVRATRAVVPAAPTRPPTRWQFDLAAHGGAELGLAPGAGAGARLHLEASNDTTAYRVSFGGTRAATGAFASTLWAGRADLCPLTFSTTAVTARACASLSLGRFVGAGADVFDASRATSWWVAPGAVARLRWRATETIFLETEVFGAAALVRPRVVLAPAETLYTSIGTAGASAGAGVRFW